MTGAELIAAERQRQIEAEGWTPEHDDGHTQGELAAAAQCYLARHDVRSDWNEMPPDWWPWNAWWKPSRDPVRNLVKAGALIAAEIDRLRRTNAEKGTPMELGTAQREMTREELENKIVGLEAELHDARCVLADREAIIEQHHADFASIDSILDTAIDDTLGGSDASIVLRLSGALADIRRIVRPVGDKASSTINKASAALEEGD